MGKDSGRVETAACVRPEQIASAIARLRQLPAAAPAARCALAQLDRPDYAVEELKKTLLSDAAVSARILRLANSAYFGFRSEVRTVSQAIVVLGPQRIRTLLFRVVADELWSEMAHGDPAAPLREMSRATATASCTLAQLLFRDDAEEMLLAGLLHNIGDLFLISQFPAEYQSMRELCRDLWHADAAIRVFGMTPSQAGKRLLEAWSFPPLYLAVVEHLADPFSPECPPEYRPAVALVSVGKALAEPFECGAATEDALAILPYGICDRLGLQQDLLMEVYETLPQRMSLEQLQAAR